LISGGRCPPYAPYAFLKAVEAAELFDLFFAGKKFPKKYALREKDV